MAIVRVALETSGASLTNSSQAGISGQPLRFSFNRPCLQGAALFVHAKSFGSNTFSFLKIAHTYTYMHTIIFFYLLEECVHMCYATCMEVRGQLARISSPLLLCGFQRSNSGHQDCNSPGKNNSKKTTNGVASN